jgi:hypothetical protein
MHPDDAQATMQFAQAYAAGDQESAIQWMINNAKTLAGDRFQQYLNPQQQAAAQASIATNAMAQGQAAGMTADQIQQLVSQEIANFQEQQEIARHEVEIDQTIRDFGLQPETPLAQAIIVNAMNRDDLDLRAAYNEMETQILQQAQAIVERRRSAGNAMPTAAPTGVNGVPMSGASPRDRAMARLNQQGL